MTQPTSSRSFYSVYLCDQDGVRLADVSNFINLQYARVTNAPSLLSIELPLSVDLNKIILPDGRIEVWRSVADRASVLEGECQWLIQAIEQKINADGSRTLIVEAVHPLWSLGQPGRYALFARRTTQTRKSGPADDVIKAIVREQASEPTDTLRQLPFGVAQNTSQAPTISKGFAWRPVLEVIQEIAQDTTEDGTYLAFDIVNTGSAALQFRTYIDQRGIDRRFPNGVVPLLIGPEYGNVGELTIRREFGGEVTAVTVLGPGQTARRQTTTQVNTPRSLRSPWRYREFVIDSSESDTVAERRGEARAALRAGRPFITLQGRLLSTQNSLYGRDWGWGDYLTLQSGFGLNIDSRVDAVTVQVSQREERIDAILRGEQYL